MGLSGGGHLPPNTLSKMRVDVFFIRHNGGWLWVDELGWPWPKHGCFDNLPASAAQRRLTDSWMSVHSPIACVVSETAGQVGAPGFSITLVCTDGKTRRVTANDVFGVRNLIGELGVLSERDRKLLCGTNVIPITSSHVISQAKSAAEQTRQVVVASRAETPPAPPDPSPPLDWAERRPEYVKVLAREHGLLEDVEIIHDVALRAQSTMRAPTSAPAARSASRTGSALWSGRTGWRGSWMSCTSATSPTTTSAAPPIRPS